MAIGRNYVRGPLIFMAWPVAAASAAIEVGDMIMLASGYAKQAAAGEAIVGVAFEKVASPSSNGDITVKVNVSREAVYRYPIDTGTVAQSNMTAGGNADAGTYSSGSTVDVTSPSNNDLRIVEVDTTNNEFLITLV